MLRCYPEGALTAPCHNVHLHFTKGESELASLSCRRDRLGIDPTCSAPRPPPSRPVLLLLFPGRKNHSPGETREDHITLSNCKK